MVAMQVHPLESADRVSAKRSGPKWDPRKIRDGKRVCRRCGTSMRYKRVQGNMVDWSPCDHAWFCESCPEVCVIDGSIDPEENTWQSRERKNQRRQLNKYLASLFGIQGDEDTEKS